MAPSIAIATSSPSKSPATKDGGYCGTEEALRRRNRELEIELQKSAEREEKMRDELHRTSQRLRIIEEAEERLSTQLGDLEAEAVDQARLYYAQIISLKNQLSQAHRLIQSTKKIQS